MLRYIYSLYIINAYVKPSNDNVDFNESQIVFGQPFVKPFIPFNCIHALEVVY